MRYADTHIYICETHTRSYRTPVMCYISNIHIHIHIHAYVFTHTYILGKLARATLPRLPRIYVCVKTYVCIFICICIFVYTYIYSRQTSFRFICDMLTHIFIYMKHTHVHTGHLSYVVCSHICCVHTHV